MERHVLSTLRGRRKTGRERGREKSTPLPFSLFPHPPPLSTPATQATSYTISWKCVTLEKWRRPSALGARKISVMILLHEKFLQFDWLRAVVFQLNLKYLWYKQIIAWFVRDIWHKYHLWYFKIVSNFTRLTARELTYNNFELSLVVFMPNIITNHAITYTYATTWEISAIWLA